MVHGSTVAADARAWGEARVVFAIFVLAQVLDGVLTYVGVSVLGVEVEANVILAGWMELIGAAGALLGEAIGLRMRLHFVLHGLVPAACRHGGAVPGGRSHPLDGHRRGAGPRPLTFAATYARLVFGGVKANGNFRGPGPAADERADQKGYGNRKHGPSRKRHECL
jgi:hypothetical protein